MVVLVVQQDADFGEEKREQRARRKQKRVGCTSAVGWRQMANQLASSSPTCPVRDVRVDGAPCGGGCGGGRRGQRRGGIGGTGWVVMEGLSGRATSQSSSGK